MIRLLCAFWLVCCRVAWGHLPQASHTAYYHADGAGNVTALMDAQEGIAARYLYNPFGRLTGQWGSMAVVNRYRFSSKEVHAVSGLSYYGFRFYDAGLQRWLNPDPLGEAGGINLFGFVSNDPLTRIDPFGESDENRPPVVVFPPSSGQLPLFGPPALEPNILQGVPNPLDLLGAIAANEARANQEMAQWIAHALGLDADPKVVDRISHALDSAQIVAMPVGMEKPPCPPVAKGTQGLRSLMTADDAARYNAYWAQQLSGPTRQRLKVAPGTRRIADVKLSTQTGQPYVRQTIYDEYGRATGVNDFTTHGRPQAHTDPHYHAIDSQNWKGGVPHGPATPGLHPDTP